MCRSGAPRRPSPSRTTASGTLVHPRSTESPRASYLYFRSAMAATYKPAIARGHHGEDSTLIWRLLSMLWLALRLKRRAIPSRIKLQRDYRDGGLLLVSHLKRSPTSPAIALQ